MNPGDVTEVNLIASDVEYSKALKLGKEGFAVKVDPNRLKSGFTLGRDAERIFRIANLIRRHPQAKIKFTSEVRQIDAGSLGSLALASVISGEPSNQRFFGDYQNYVDTILSSKDAGVTNSLTLFCTSLSPEHSEFPRALYFPMRKCRTESDHCTLIEQVAILMGASQELDRIENSTLSRKLLFQALSKITYEAFVNTHEHGRRSEARVRRIDYSKCVRGISFRFDRVSVAELEGGAMDAELIFFLTRTLNRQIASARGKRGQDQRTIPIFEISVFDNGPGMVETIASKANLELPLNQLKGDEEVRHINSCFEKHKTSKSDTNAGVGLFAITKQLNRLGAYLTVRTGRVRLYRDFALNPFTEVETAEVRSQFLSPCKKSTDNLDEDIDTYSTRGTLLTALVPLIDLSATMESLR